MSNCNQCNEKDARLESLRETITDLEAQVAELRALAQAVVDEVMMPVEGDYHYREEESAAMDKLKAVLLEDKEVVYPDEIPVDRAGRPMFNRYGDKLDVEDRE